jgi:hypothetical protein
MVARVRMSVMPPVVNGQEENNGLHRRTG